MLICFWIRAAQCCSAGARLLLKTHPRLVEAKGVSMVLQVLLLPGLLELLPQPPYPVMVTGGNLPAATERNKSARPRWMWKFSKICSRRSNAGVSRFSEVFSHPSSSRVLFQSLTNILDLTVIICAVSRLFPEYFLDCKNPWWTIVTDTCRFQAAEERWPFYGLQSLDTVENPHLHPLH